jgi:hypothetical protein
MVATRIATLAAVSIAFACTVPERAPPREPAQTGVAGPIAAAPAAPPASSAPAAAPTPSAPAAAPAVAAPSPPAVAEAAPVTAAPQPAAAAPAAAPTAPSAKAPPKGSPSPPASAAPPAKKEAPPPAAKKPETPPLDLASLETRLKETKAIGVMTKLSLKNQVDDLLDQFRAYYQGKLKITLAELRKSFDLLFLKVLSLLQDGDPPLATAIVASREAIWGILSDPVKFAKFASI